MRPHPLYVAESLFVLGRVSRGERSVAIASAALFAVVTVVALQMPDERASQTHYGLAALAACWIVADVLTALLLFSQFSITGTVYLAVMGAAYLATGLMTVSCCFFFPGSVHPVQAMSLAQQQIAPWLWWSRQFVFATIVGSYAAFDPLLRRRVASGAALRTTLGVTIAVVVIVWIVVTGFVANAASALPPLAVAGRFTPFFFHVTVPVLIAATSLALAALLAGAGRWNVLQTWLAVAVFAALLDAVADLATPARFSGGWYAGLIDLVASAVVVLVALLCGFLRTFSSFNRLARFDALTGLHNRRTFDEYLDRSIDDATLRGEGVALAMIDVDCFKAYNDHYGHAGGDDCLRRIADAIRQALPHAGQIAARYGGEEFTVLLPGADTAVAAAVARRINESVERLAIPHDASTVHACLTISIGVAVARPADRMNPAELFACADAALYDAKRDGRNRVLVRPSVSARPHADNVTYLRTSQS